MASIVSNPVIPPVRRIRLGSTLSLLTWHGGGARGVGAQQVVDHGGLAAVELAQEQDHRLGEDLGVWRERGSSG